MTRLPPFYSRRVPCVTRCACSLKNKNVLIFFYLNVHEQTAVTHRFTYELDSQNKENINSFEIHIKRRKPDKIIWIPFFTD